MANSNKNIPSLKLSDGRRRYGAVLHVASERPNRILRSGKTRVKASNQHESW